MQISVNGQNYDRWEDVPADLRAQLLAVLPDSDGNGIPDAIENPLTALSGTALPDTATTVRSTQVSVNGKQYLSPADLPPEIVETIRAAGFGGFFGAAGQPVPSSASPPTTADQSTAPTAPVAGQLNLNGELVDAHAALGNQTKRWWQFWK